MAHKVKKKKNLRGVRRCRYGERQRFLGSFGCSDCGLESAVTLCGDDFEVRKAEQRVFSKVVVNVLPVDVGSK